MHRAVGKELQGGEGGESLLPEGGLKEIQVLLVPLLTTLQQQSELCPLQLQRPDLPGTRGEGPCAASGTELPQQHRVAVSISARRGSFSLLCPP